MLRRKHVSIISNFQIMFYLSRARIQFSDLNRNQKFELKVSDSYRETGKREWVKNRWRKNKAMKDQQIMVQHQHYISTKKDVSKENVS